MPRRTDTARYVLSHPQHYCDRPHLFREAWAILKAAAGQEMRRDTLGPSRHAESVVPARPLVAELDAARARARTRIRAHLAQSLGPTDTAGPGGAA